MMRIRVIKLSRIIYYAVIIVLAVAAVGLLYRLLPAGEDNDATPAPTETQVVKQQGAVQTEDSGALEDAFLPRTIQVDMLPLTPGASVQPVQVSMTSSPYEFEETDEQMDARMLVEILDQQGEYMQKFTNGKPRVLIYHTHTFEAYEQNDADKYIEAGTWRTKDENYNIVRVGEELAQQLRAMGMEVVHDTTAFEPPKLGTAYIRSLEALDAYTARGEVFDMYIDMHRDAYSTRAEQQTMTLPSGERAARIMMLIGNGQGSDGKGFSIMPNYKENLKLAQFLTDSINGQAPGLCRDVMVKTGRYNQHVSTHAVLIEVGHNKNTLTEALNTVPYMARAIRDSFTREGAGGLPADSE